MSLVWRLGSKRLKSPERYANIFLDDDLFGNLAKVRLLRKDANSFEKGNPFWRTRAAMDGMQATMMPIAISITLAVPAVTHQ